MDIVAEGVETEFEAVMMTRFGCTELQGFYFSRPIAVAQMVDFLETFEPKAPEEGTEPMQAEAGGGLAG